MGRKHPLALLTIVTLLASLCLAGCSNSAGAPSLKVEKKTYPFILQTDSRKPIEESEMNLYFVNDGDVPYVAVSDFLPFFGSLYEDEELGIPAITFEFERDGDNFRAKRTDNECAMSFNAKTDQIDFLNYDGFIQSPGNSALIGLVRIGEEGTGGVSRLMKANRRSYDRPGLGVVLNLAEYQIDMVEDSGECYVPLQTMHDILLGHNYFYTVFTGEKVCIFSCGCDFDDQVYSLEPGKMSEEYAKFNCNELLFLLDYFYGLKPEHNIADFYSLVNDLGLYNDLVSTDPAVFDKALLRLLSLYLDDLHSGMSKKSCLSPKREVQSEDGNPNKLDPNPEEMGASATTMLSNSLLYGTARATYEPDMNIFDTKTKVYQYKEVGDTAIITFDEFSVNKADYYTEADLDNPQDTIELIAAAHRQIMREDSPIKNVVLDLSNNGGGAADAAAFIIAWITGESPVALRNTLTGAQSIVSYEADVNLDGQYDYNDSISELLYEGDLKVYCLTSPKSFSCGNLVPAALKGTFNVSIIGQRSGGGSCIVLPCTTASGAQFQISGTSQISTIKNGSFYNADTGIEVDANITDINTMYDREKLVEFIHGLK
jgi:hypothetical protein